MKTTEQAVELLMTCVDMVDDPEKFKKLVIELLAEYYVEGFRDGMGNILGDICECKKSEATP